MTDDQVEYTSTPEIEAMPEDDSQVEIKLITKLEAKYQIPEDKIIVPGSVTRLDLSELVNESLSLEERIPFDFLIEGEFIRGSLSRHCIDRGILSEKTVEIEYVIAIEEPESSTLTEPQKDWICGISVSSNAFFTSSMDGVLTKYDLESGKVTLKSSQSQLPIHDVACTDNGVVVTVSKDGHVRFSDMDSLEVISCGKLDHGIHSVSLCPFDHTLVLTGSAHGQVHLWNVPVVMKTSKSKKRTSVEQVEPRATLLQKPSTIVGLAWLSLSKAVAASQDGNMHFFDPMSGQTFPTISTSRAMSSMSLLGSSKVVTGHPDGRIIFWDLKKDGQALSMEALNSCRSHGRMIARLAAQPGSESLIASASLDGCIKLFDRRASHFAVQSISLPTSERALVVAWIDESKFLSGASDGVVRVHTMKLA